MKRRLLERIVEERAGQTVVGSMSVAVERLAEEIAREALADNKFRRALRQLVRTRSQEILDDLMRDEPKRARGRAGRNGRKRR